MIIVPPFSLNSRNFAAGGIYEPTSANFPALKRHMKFAETSGTSLREEISDSSIPGFSAITSVDGGKAVSLASNSSNVAVPAGFWGPIGTSPFLLFMVAKITGAPASSQVGRIGLTTGARVALHPSTNGALMNDGVTTFQGTPTGIANDAKMGLGISSVISAPNAVPNWYAFDNTDDSFATAAITPAASGGIVVSDGMTLNSGAAVQYYELMLWVFAAGLPADIRAAIEWMTKQALNGNDFAWPLWKGLA